MNAEAEKAERERSVFEAFIQESGIPINPESVESCRPPKPDILCLHGSEGHVAFELVEVCDPNIAQTTSVIGKEGGVRFVRGSDPSLDVLRKKLKKTYKSEYPIELICYQDGRTISPDAVILAAIYPLISINNGQFRRIWLLGNKCHLVWPREPNLGDESPCGDDGMKSLALTDDELWALSSAVDTTLLSIQEKINAETSDDIKCHFKSDADKLLRVLKKIRDTLNSVSQ
jgi:hypothetical protein